MLHALIVIAYTSHKVCAHATRWSGRQHFGSYKHRGSTGPAEHLLRTRPLQIWLPLF